MDANTANAWLEYGRSYARYPSLWDGSLAFASGPLQPEGATLRDYSGRTAGAAWSVGAGDVPKYTRWSVMGQAFWAGSYNVATPINDYADAGIMSYSGPITVSSWFYRTAAVDYGTIASKYLTYVGNKLDWSLRVHADGSCHFYVGDSASFVVATHGVTVPLNTWAHFAGTWDGATVTMTTYNDADGTYSSVTSGAWTADAEPRFIAPSGNIRLTMTNDGAGWNEVCHGRMWLAVL